MAKAIHWPKQFSIRQSTSKCGLRSDAPASRRALANVLDEREKAAQKCIRRPLDRGEIATVIPWRRVSQDIARLICLPTRPFPSVVRTGVRIFLMPGSLIVSWNLMARSYLATDDRHWRRLNIKAHAGGRSGLCGFSIGNGVPFYLRAGRRVVGHCTPESSDAEPRLSICSGCYFCCAPLHPCRKC
jgi:hypothetical protein